MHLYHINLDYSYMKKNLYLQTDFLVGDHVRQDSMDFSKEWEDPANCRCSNRLKPLERRKARQHQRCLAHSLVGTPNYIAPEVLLRTGTVGQRLSFSNSAIFNSYSLAAIYELSSDKI